MRKILFSAAVLQTLLLLGGCDETHGGAEVAAGASASASSKPVGQRTESIPVAPSGVSSDPPRGKVQGMAEEGVVELDWDALIPPDWRPDKLMADFDDVDSLSDDDPRAQELMDKLQALWKESPVVPDLDGKRIKLPGFMVPLEMNAETIREFLLVPYFGACIHVPPPPANQTVHVVTGEGKEYRGQLFDTVWVTGTVRVEHLSSELAEAGYQMQDARVEPYE
ncbi:MAG: DUF3299 domain-containing protein [Gammaproteobacteria bacterium]|nr:DUF3299 domain-containing protein [Gammaproteobacteria bacterium]MDJ0892104.1 DUF3299 domain-containing protein [Gammaproteobacteria bacterium]